MCSDMSVSTILRTAKPEITLHKWRTWKPWTHNLICGQERNRSPAPLHFLNILSGGREALNHFKYNSTFSFSIIAQLHDSTKLRRLSIFCFLILDQQLTLYFWSAILCWFAIRPSPGEPGFIHNDVMVRIPKMDHRNKTNPLIYSLSHYSPSIYGNWNHVQVTLIARYTSHSMLNLTGGKL